MLRKFMGCTTPNKDREITYCEEKPSLEGMHITVQIGFQVCLVYLDKRDCESDLKREDPKIWLLDRSFEWHFLAENFTHYFRMMLVHQGLPQWQFKFTPMGLTPWAEVSFNTMTRKSFDCPHVPWACNTKTF